MQNHDPGWVAKCLEPAGPFYCMISVELLLRAQSLFHRLSTIIDQYLRKQERELW